MTLMQKVSTMVCELRMIFPRFIYPASQEKLCFGKYSNVAFVLETQSPDVDAMLESKRQTPIYYSALKCRINLDVSIIDR